MTDTTALIPAPSRELAVNPIAAEQLIARWQEGRSVETQRAYAQDLAHFAKWSDRAGAGLTPGAAVDWLLSRHPGEANEISRAYRSAMVDAGLAPNTINRRLSALRSLVKLGKEFGRIGWALSIRNVRSQKYRDTRGPETDDVSRLLKAAGAHADPRKARRDVALIMLLYGAGLRRGEVANLDIADFDTRAGRLTILGKGRRERETITLAPASTRALKAWIGERGAVPGPLFCRLDRGAAAAGGELARLTGDGIHDLLGNIGTQVGLQVRPHGLRHSAITAALDAENGNVRKVRMFSRHRSVEVLLHYDDNREDLAGDVARKVTDRVETG